MDSDSVVAYKYGLVSYEEAGQPHTAVRGKYRLLALEKHEALGDEHHWLIDIGCGETCYVPEHCVVLIN